MTPARAQPRAAVFSLRVIPSAQLLAVLVSGLLAFLLLELLPCGGVACFGVAGEGDLVSSAIHAIAPAGPASDTPTSFPSHQPECALHHAHCSVLLMAALSFGAVLALVAHLRTGPPLTFPTWTVAPPLPPP
jgi:hypothetical protein